MPSIYKYAVRVQRNLLIRSGNTVKIPSNAELSLVKAGTTVPATIYFNDSYTVSNTTGSVTTDVNGNYSAFVEPGSYQEVYKGQTYSSFTVAADPRESDFDLNTFKEAFGFDELPEGQTVATREWIGNQLQTLVSAAVLESTQGNTTGLNTAQVQGLIQTAISQISIPGYVAPDLTPYARVRGSEANADIIVKTDAPVGTTLSQWVNANAYIKDGKVWLRSAATAQAPDTGSVTAPVTSTLTGRLALANEHLATNFVDSAGKTGTPITARNIAYVLEQLVLAQNFADYDLVLQWADTNLIRTSQSTAKKLWGSAYSGSAVTSYTVDTGAMLTVAGTLMRAWNVKNDTKYSVRAAQILSDLVNTCVITDEGRAYLAADETQKTVTNGHHFFNTNEPVSMHEPGAINPLYLRAAKTFTGAAIFDQLLDGRYDLLNKMLSRGGSALPSDFVGYNAINHSVHSIISGQNGWTITKSNDYGLSAARGMQDVLDDKTLYASETRGTNAITRVTNHYNTKAGAGTVVNAYAYDTGANSGTTESTEAVLYAVRFLKASNLGSGTTIRSSKIRDDATADGSLYYLANQVLGATAASSFAENLLSWRAYAKDNGTYTDITKLGPNPSVGSLTAPDSSGSVTPTTPVVVTPPATTNPSQEPVAGTKTLFVDKTDRSSLIAWALALPPGTAKTRALDIFNKNAMGFWVGEWELAANPGNTYTVDFEGLIEYLVDAKAANATGLVLSYYIPGRDLGQYSGGGAANRAAYEAYINGLCAAIGNSDVLFVYEPDSLPHLANLGGQERADRISIMTWAIQRVATLCPNARVYIDAGHSAWLSSNTIAGLLREVHVENAAGFALNISNIRPDNEIIPFGQQVWGALGMPNKRWIYDSSRNGNPVPSDPSNWANPPERQFGRSSQFGNTGITGCDGWMWWKKPGESDGDQYSNALNMFAPSAGVVFDYYLFNPNVGDNQYQSGMLQRAPATSVPLNGGGQANGSDVSTTPAPTTGGGGLVSATTLAWHNYGTQPTGITLTAIKDITVAKYTEWKTNYLTQTGMPGGMPSGAWRVKVPDADSAGAAEYINGSFSEGIGYGMMVTALASRPGSPIYDSSAKAIFDGLFKYYTFFKNPQGVMSWRIKSDGSVNGNAGATDGDRGGATDGDQDICLGLLLMSRIHGNAGAINYGTEATNLANAILKFEYVGGTLVMTNGGGWGFGADRYMPDYFHPAFMKEIGIHTGNAKWFDAITVNYPRAVEFFTKTYNTGFVPDQSNRNGGSLGFSYTYGYNAIRMPFRLALDYAWNNDTRAGNHLKEMALFVRQYSNNDVTLSRAEGNLDGTNRNTYINKAFMSGFGLAGMTQTDGGTWQKDVINWLNVGSGANELNYFGDSLRILSLLIWSGEFKPYRAS